ncbi:hypothetical protein [Nocardioides massiliensis]|uniref:hypothetical protein n=1 Tax=Nocardioides massiliensis TaxID=1325935 RepID=UPI00083792CA|nr:hypothetical protein [Nocardioides massiliensis]
MAIFAAGTIVSTVGVVALGSPSASASQGCTKREESVITGKGRGVWIPSSLAGPWTAGEGSVSISWTEGKDYSQARGSSRAVGGEGKLKLPLGEASATYNHQWNKNTTTTTRRTTTVNRTWTIPKKGKHRIRWYQRGREFRATRYIFYVNCPSVSRTWVVRVPLRRDTQANRLIAIEKFKNRNKPRY